MTTDDRELKVLLTEGMFTLRTRLEYFKDKSQHTKLWSGIDLNVEGDEICVQLGNIDITHKGYIKWFKEFVKNFKLIDRTNKGYYCVQCKKFSKLSLMRFHDKSIVVDIENSDCKMIVLEHYDGCKGWD